MFRSAQCIKRTRAYKHTVAEWRTAFSQLVHVHSTHLVIDYTKGRFHLTSLNQNHGFTFDSLKLNRGLNPVQIKPTEAATGLT